LELTVSQAGIILSPTISPAQYAKFNNSEGALYYSIFDFLSIGFNIRQETFSRILQGKIPIGNTYRYEQQPNLTTFSLTTRFNAGSIGIFDRSANYPVGLIMQEWFSGL